jgi:hypothetical protein
MQFIFNQNHDKYIIKASTTEKPQKCVNQQISKPLVADDWITKRLSASI